MNKIKKVILFAIAAASLVSASPVAAFSAFDTQLLERNSDNTGNFTNFLTSASLTNPSFFIFDPISELPKYAQLGSGLTWDGSFINVVSTQVQSDWSDASTTASDFIKNKPTMVSQFTNDSGYMTTAFATSTYAAKSSLATVATSGNYADLTGKPTVANVQSGSCTTDSNGNCTLTFVTAFSGAPKVAVTALQGTTGTLTNAQVTSKSATSTTIHVNTLASVIGILTLVTTASGITVDIIATQ